MARRQSPPFTIDDTEYRITALPATKSRGLNFRLMKIIGPGIALASAQDELRIDELLKSALVDLSEDLLTDLCNAFGAVTQIGGLPEIADERGFDDHFSGRIFTMYKWLFECLKWEYSDFLSGLPDLEKLGQKVAAQAESVSPTI